MLLLLFHKDDELVELVLFEGSAFFREHHTITLFSSSVSNV